MSQVRFVLPVNPVPWAVGTVYTGRKNGKIIGGISPDHTLVAYQEAVRDSLRPFAPERPFPGPYSLCFGFSRQLEQFVTEAGKHGQRNHADATNMQKATEDALQGLLIENDRDVIHVESDNYRQATTSIPFVAIMLKYEVDWNNRHFNDADRAMLDAKIVQRCYDYSIKPDTNEKEVWKP